MAGDPLGPLRARITANDEAIVALVNERLRLVAELWDLKQRVGAERVDAARELALRQQLHAASKGRLSPAGVDRLLDTLLALTKDELR
jgi:chorismate mutase